MRNIEYINLTTGEIVSDHRAAVEWFRAGDNVAVLLNGEQRATWEH